MFVPEEIFREYDIRGLAGEQLTEENVYLIARAYASFISKKYASRTLVVGRDNRVSSKPFRDSVVKALIDSGFSVIDVGVVPTPVYYFAIVKFKAVGGLMVTASHLPSEYNGLKLNDGILTLEGSEIKKLYAVINNMDFVNGVGEIKEEKIIDEYVEEIVSNVKIEKKLKVVIDCGNGVTGLVAPKLFNAIGCEVIELFCDLDSSFPNHHPDPVREENIIQLKEKVLETKADLGIAFDADGDRIGAVTEKSETVAGDMLLALFSRDVLLKQKGAKIVFEVKCSKALEEEIFRLGGVPLMWKTGHSLIKKKMKEVNSPLAGEMSGHMFFADKFYGFDDGLYAGVRLIEFLSEQNKTFSNIANEIPTYFVSPEIRVKTSDSKKWTIVQNIADFYSQNFNVIDIDGARINFPNGWALVRASNTAPELVLRFEAKSSQDLEDLQSKLKQKLLAFDSTLKIDF